MRKKIATLTFHRAINYGAILQTYALQKSIQKMGYDTEVLDYRNDFLESLHNPYSLKLYRTPLHFLYAIYRNRVKRDNRKSFRQFLQENVAVSPVTYNTESIKNAEDQYDAFMVGSDQVWNCNCTKFDKTYFLDFIENPNKKYSYAASIGIRLETEDLKKEYRRLLEDYQVINVREEQGRQELAEIGLDANTTVDPTLLLDREAWLTLAQKPAQMQAVKRYLLVYVIVETPTIFETAKKIAAERNLEVVYINEMLRQKPGIKNLKCITPNEWLWLFANADFIVTNSFHGTAFSVNFQRQFAVEPLPVKTNVNSRIYDFLSMVGLSDRIADKAPEQLAKTWIDYQNVDLEMCKKDSLGILNHTLDSIVTGDQMSE